MGRKSAKLGEAEEDPNPFRRNLALRKENDLIYQERWRRARARGNGDRNLTLTLDLPRVGEKMKSKKLTGVGCGGDGRGAERRRNGLPPAPFFFTPQRRHRNAALHRELRDAARRHKTRRNSILPPLRTAAITAAPDAGKFLGFRLFLLSR